MKINVKELELVLAKQCLLFSHLIKENAVSSSTLTKIRNDPTYDATTRTVGKIAQVLNVPVEQLLE